MKATKVEFSWLLIHCVVDGWRCSLQVSLRISANFELLFIRWRVNHNHWKGSDLSFNLWGFQFSSVTQSCPTLCVPMDCSMPGFSVHNQLPEFTQIHVHRVSYAIQLSHPLSSPSPSTFNLAQHQGLFQWVSSSHQVAKLLEFQLQHQYFLWIIRTDFL